MSKNPEQPDHVKEFLARGGVIQQIPPGKSGYVEGESRSSWSSAKKKPAAAKPDSTEK